MARTYFTVIKNLAKETFRNANNDNLALHGAAIAFYTIFSAAPLLIIILALSNVFLNDQQAAHNFFRYLAHLTGPDIANSLNAIAKASRRQVSGFIATIIAGAVMLFGATTVITQLKNSLNTIWEAQPPPLNSVLQYLFNRLLALIIIIVFTGLLLTSVVLEGGVSFFTSLLQPYLPPISPVIKVISSLFSIGMTIIFFTLIFKILPDVQARWRDVLVGACVTTFLFLIGKYLVGFYLSNTAMQASYKTAGSFIIFLIWTYYNVQILLVGAEFTQVYARLYGQELRSTKKAKILPWH